MRKRTILISLSALAAIAMAGGAYAATRSGSKSRAKPFIIDAKSVLSDAAAHLHVSVAQLTGAFKQSLIDQINAQHLPTAQANALRKQIEHGPGFPFGPALFGPPPPFGASIHARINGPGVQVIAGPGPFFGPPVVLPAAAHYLGLSVGQLVQQLRSGKTLADIARAQGTSTSGLERTLATAVKTMLEKSFAAQRTMEQHFLANLTRLVQSVVNSKGPFGPPGAG